MDQPIRQVLGGDPNRGIVDFAAERTQGLLQSALDPLPISIAVMDAQGLTVAVNKASRQYVLQTQGRSWLPGESFVDSLRHCPATEVSAAIKASWDALISGELQSFQRTYEVQFGDSVRVKQLRIFHFAFSQEPLLVMTHEDVTGITSAYREVDQLMAIQEDERQRLA